MVFGCSGSALIGGRIGAQDYAGGTACTSTPVSPGLVLALVIGKRRRLAQGPRCVRTT